MALLWCYYEVIGYFARGSPVAWSRRGAFIDRAFVTWAVTDLLVTLRPCVFDHVLASSELDVCRANSCILFRSPGAIGFVKARGSQRSCV